MTSQSMPAQSMSDRLRFLFLFLTLITGLQACIPTPSFTVRVPESDTAYDRVERPVGVEQIPIKVGVYYGEEFVEYEHQEFTIGRSKVEVPVGGPSQAHFNKVFSALFSKTVRVHQRPPYTNVGYASELSAVIEVRIEDFRWSAQTFGPSTAEVTYRFVVYSPSGNTITTWTESGADIGKPTFLEDPLAFQAKQVVKAMRVASGRFMDSFNRRPEIQRWLAATGERKIASAAVPTTAAAAATAKSMQREIKSLSIEATLYSQHGLERRPYDSTGVRSQILAAHVKIKNAGASSVVVRPTDVRLSPRAGVRLDPASAGQVAQRMHHSPELEASDIAAPMIGPLFSLILAMDEADEKNSQLNKIKAYVNSTHLQDATVGPGDSVSGFVYFEALGIDGKFDEAELRIRLGDALSTENYDVTLPVGRGTTVANDIALVSLGAAGVVAGNQSRQTVAKQPASPSTNEQSSSPRKLRVAILPWATRGGRGWTASEWIEFGRRYVNGHAELMLAYSYNSPGPEAELGLEQSAIWQGGAVRKEPIKSKVYALRDELDVDIALAFYLSPRTAGGYNRDKYHVEIYIFDLEYRRMYHGRADEFQYKQVNAQLFDELFADREPSGVRVVAATSAVAASVGYQASVNTDSVEEDRLAGGESVNTPKVRGGQAVAFAGTATLADQQMASQAVRVALLPFASRCSGCNSQAPDDLVKFSRAFLGSQKDVTLTHSYYHPDLSGGSEINSASLWEGNVHKTPRKGEIYSAGRRLAADVALTFYHAPRTADSYASDLYSVDVYLFDLTHERMYHGRGDERDYEKVTAKLFDELIADREKSGIRKVAGGATVAAASFTQPTTASTAAVIQSLPVSAAGDSAALEEGQLSGPELREFLSGNTVSGRTEKYTDFNVYFSPDGRTSGQSKRTRYDTGTWQVDDNGTYCRQWDRWQSAARRCYKVFRVGENRIKFRAIGSNDEATYTVRFGDPENLKGRI